MMKNKDLVTEGFYLGNLTTKDKLTIFLGFVTCFLWQYLQVIFKLIINDIYSKPTMAVLLFGLKPSTGAFCLQNQSH